MKKAYILILFLIAAMTVNACSKAPAEKEPVIVADTFFEDNKENSSTEEYRNNPDKGTESEYQTSAGDKSGETGNETAGEVISASGDDTVSDTSANPSENAVQEADPFKEVESRKLIIEIEGMQEEINGTVFHSALGYQITYDAVRFTATHTDYGVDSIIAENPDPEIYPYVTVYISRSDKTASDIDWQNINVETISGNKATYIDDVQIGNTSAKHYKSVAGKEWNSIINHYYFIEHENYYFIISTQHFLEAEEGYGARIQAMLNTFEFE